MPAATCGDTGGQVVLFQAPDGTVQLKVRLERETTWLTKKQMALLFDTERSVVTKHLRNIFQSGELEGKSNVQKMHILGSDKPVVFTDALISAVYRVNSKPGTQFRIKTPLPATAFARARVHRRWKPKSMPGKASARLSSLRLTRCACAPTKTSLESTRTPGPSSYPGETFGFASTDGPL